MNKKRNPRRALVLSIFSLLLCASLLIGSTFAWFTDTATTNVNSIQAGNLKIKLEMLKGTDADGKEIWEDAKGKTLDFNYSTVDGNKLWEPGASYALPKLRVSNDGDLKIKYKVVITGINGESKNDEILDLNDAIDWTISYPGKNTSGEAALDVGGSSDITISGTMKTEAGNEFQGLSIKGISVAVYATQLGGELDGLEGEYDSNGNTYDKNATYGPVVLPTIDAATMTAGTDSNNKTFYTYTDSTMGISAQLTNPEGVKMNDGATGVIFSFKDSSAMTDGTVNSATEETLAYDISIENANMAGSKAVVNIDVGAGKVGFKVFHKGTAMTAGSAADALNPGKYFYNTTTGILTICVDNFSNFTFAWARPVAKIGDNAYATLDAAFAAAQVGDTVNVVRDFTTDATKTAREDRLTARTSMTLNLGAHTITVPAELEPTDNCMGISVDNGATLTVNATTGGLTSGTADKDGVYCFNVANGHLVINGGNYYGGITAVNLTTTSAKATINGGTFRVTKNGSMEGAGTYLLNFIDSAFVKENLVVAGGVFYNFNPAESYSETTQPVNFLALNYVSKASDDGSYTVELGSSIVDPDKDQTTDTPGTLTELKDAFEKAATQEGTSELIINLDKNFDVKGQWTAFTPKGYSGVKKVTINGNGHKITGLNEPLMIGSFAGQGSITINNLTIENANISGEGYNGLGLGAFVAYSDASGSLNLNGCKLVSSTVTCTGEFAGGLVGYSSSNINFTNCEVSDSTITSGKSAGAVIGQDAAAGTMNGINVTNCKINSTGMDEGKKYCGTVVGTSNAAASTYTNVTTSNNTINDAASETYYGRAFVGLSINGTEYVQ